MSYVYSFYNCFSPYTETLYPLYTQNVLQNPLQSLYFGNPSPIIPQFQNQQKFKPIVVSAMSTCQSLASNTSKPKQKRETKQIKKEYGKNKDESFGWRNQNKDRNVISSILKGYTHCVLQGRGMVKLIQQLAKKRSIQNGVSRFYEYMSQKFPTRKSYVGLRYMQQTLSSSPSEDSMAFILRVTLSHYLKNVYPLFVITNCRMKKKDRFALLKKAKTINSLVFAK